MTNIIVQEWNDSVLVAAKTQCGICSDADKHIGINLIAKNGDIFAHVHFDLESTKKFLEDLRSCIDRINVN